MNSRQDWVSWLIVGAIAVWIIVAVIIEFLL